MTALPPTVPPVQIAIAAPTGPVSYQILLSVTVDPSSTQLSAREHASTVIRGIQHQINRGLLTVHEPAALIERYELVRISPPT